MVKSKSDCPMTWVSPLPGRYKGGCPDPANPDLSPVLKKDCPQPDWENAFGCTTRAYNRKTRSVVEWEWNKSPEPSPEPSFLGSLGSLGSLLSPKNIALAGLLAHAAYVYSRPGGSSDVPKVYQPTALPAEYVKPLYDYCNKGYFRRVDHMNGTVTCVRSKFQEMGGSQ